MLYIIHLIYIKVNAIYYKLSIIIYTFHNIMHKNEYTFRFYSIFCIFRAFYTPFTVPFLPIFILYINHFLINVTVRSHNQSGGQIPPILPLLKVFGDDGRVQGGEKNTFPKKVLLPSLPVTS